MNAAVRPRRGQALAELAVALPVLLLVVLGLFDIGRAVFTYNGLTNAAREGVRLAIVNQDQDLVAQRAQAMAFGTEISSAPEATVRFFSQLGPGGTDDVTLNDECGVDKPMAVGCIAVIEPRASWQAITPLIGNLLGPITLTARAELAVEFVCPNPAIPAYASSDLCPKQR
jgi:hypothetical protein